MDRRDLDALWVDSNVSTRRNSIESLPTMTVSPPDDNAAHDARCHPLNIMSPIVEKPCKVDIEKNIDCTDSIPQKLSLRQRIHHFTWAWFTLPMSSGGVSLLIYVQPHQFSGLKVIGTVFYAFTLLAFTIVCLTMLCRFLLHRDDMTKSVLHPREGFFFPTFFLAVATLITSTERYAIPENNTTFIWSTQTIFWVYLVVTLVLAVGQYSYLFAGHSFGLQTMMPSWILPIFPIMLTGTIATVILEQQSHINPMPIIVAGVTCQGLGFWVAVMMYAHMVGRLMQSGLPNREHRPGLFMCVGPPAFTAFALVGMANQLPQDLVSAGNFPVDVDTVRAVALMSAIFLWALSLWWFLIAFVAIAMSPPEYFHLGWWPMVFPNVGFTIATISIGSALECEGILWFANALTVLIFVTFCVVFYFNMRAVVVGDIMYTGKDEDTEDHH
ncbi:voltage-dependent anion channel-domain-containing protein [Dactylonectria macrodidyma]|uniref:Voltage-dependent anion channel-domain-containing protein n=1 Tax=Dactylonectria macrodidyma TaxID=307937 RepID=A0A9P9FIV4_9HYPO|nr:voltage-dependent anion channel-domain-containing protein [Dactylonectria macrodidyma]